MFELHSTQPKFDVIIIIVLLTTNIYKTGVSIARACFN
jgi:hypothetical protein